MNKGRTTLLLTILLLGIVALLTALSFSPKQPPKTGELSFADSICTTGPYTINGDVKIIGNLNVTKNTEVGGDLKVLGTINGVKFPQNNTATIQDNSTGGGCRLIARLNPSGHYTFNGFFETDIPRPSCFMQDGGCTIKLKSDSSDYLTYGNSNFVDQGVFSILKSSFNNQWISSALTYKTYPSNAQITNVNTGTFDDGSPTGMAEWGNCRLSDDSTQQMPGGQAGVPNAKPGFVHLISTTFSCSLYVCP